MNLINQFFNPSPDAKPSKWLRIFIPFALVAVWLALGGIGGPYFGKIEEVSTNNLTDFLPSSADATKAQEISAKFRDSNAIPAIVVLESEEALAQSDLATAGELQQKIAAIKGVDGQISPAIPSEDGKAVQMIALVDTSQEVDEVVEEIRTEVHDASTENVQGYVAGPAGFSSELTKAFSGIDGLLLLVALAVVLVILLIVYKSPLLPILVLLTSIFALSASVLVVWWLAKWDILQLNGQVQGILFILVIGAATDYSLLFVARFREALRHNPSVFAAIVNAIKGSFEPIIASGGTVIAGLLCLLLSDLNSNKFLGPVSSIGIVFAMLSALTLLPSLLLLFGRAAFWPFKPQYQPELADEEVSSSGIWAKFASIVDSRPRLLWISLIALLSIATYGATQLKTDGVADSDIIVGESEFRDGQNALSRHFPGGSGNPAIIIASSEKLEDVVDALESTEGVSTVDAVSDNSPSGTVPLGQNKVPFGPLASATPAERDGQVMLQATLTAQPDSEKAEEVVKGLRDSLRELDPTALIGGSTATNIDAREAARSDQNTIIPLVLLVITLILMVLLRSIVAPIVLIWTTVLSFGATLGVAAFVFNNVLKMPGADPVVPLYAFIFLVALGIDYNIFLMTRVREESQKIGTRQGIMKGLIITGGVITSAGIVLAATFAALSVIPILFLTQIAFLVAFGVLLDTFVIRSILVPALIRDIGAFSWWPSKLRHKQ